MTTSLTEDRLQEAQARIDKAEAVMGTVSNLLEGLDKADRVAKRARKGIRLATLALVVGGALVALLVVRTRSSGYYTAGNEL